MGRRTIWDSGRQSDLRITTTRKGRSGVTPQDDRALACPRQVPRHGSSHQRLEGLGVDRVALAQIDGAAHGAVEAGVEEAVRVLQRRAIDLREGDTVDPEAFEALVRAAVARNVSRAT